ncbi:MAG: hypothetical protein EPN91_01080 [Salinibacterium sp.]|nr:MAG: hypothetical protein EPN91_01080 [Salinibacterium sp.]
MTRRKTLALAAIVAPAIIIAGLGFTHPHDLVRDNAHWWLLLHLILMPLFPLLGVSIWILLRGYSGFLAWGARASGLFFIVFYGALDAIAGVAVGTVMVASGAASDDHVASIQSLYAIANKVGLLGAIFFLIAGMLAAAAIARAGSRLGLLIPAAALLLVADALFLHSHIYWPVGVLTVLAFGVALALLELAKPTQVEPA